MIFIFFVVPFAFYDTKSFAYVRYDGQTVGCTTLHTCNNMISISIFFFSFFQFRFHTEWTLCTS